WGHDVDDDTAHHVLRHGHGIALSHWLEESQHDRILAPPFSLDIGLGHAERLVDDDMAHVRARLVAHEPRQWDLDAVHPDRAVGVDALVTDGLSMRGTARQE